MKVRILLIVLILQIILWHLFFDPLIYNVNIVTQYDDASSLMHTSTRYNNYFFVPYHLFASLSFIPGTFFGDNMMLINSYIWLFYLLITTLLTLDISYKYYKTTGMIISSFLLLFNSFSYSYTYLYLTILPAWAFITVAFWATLNIVDTNKYRYYFLMSIAVGIASMTRIEMIMLYPVFISIIIINNFRRNNQRHITIVRIIISSFIVGILFIIPSTITYVTINEIKIGPSAAYSPFESSFQRIPQKLADDHFAGLVKNEYPFNHNRPFKVDQKIHGTLYALKNLFTYMITSFYSNGSKIIIIIGLLLTIIYRKSLKHLKIYIILIISTLLPILINFYALIFHDMDYAAYRMMIGYPFVILLLSGFIININNIIFNNIKPLSVKSNTYIYYIPIIVMLIIVEPFNYIRYQYGAYSNMHKRNKILDNNKILMDAMNKDNNERIISSNTSIYSLMTNSGYIPFPKNTFDSTLDYIDFLKKYGATHFIYYPLYRRYNDNVLMSNLLEYLDKNAESIYKSDELIIYKFTDNSLDIKI